jgi:hypothetical protein
MRHDKYARSLSFWNGSVPGDDPGQPLQIRDGVVVASDGNGAPTNWSTRSQASLEKVASGDLIQVAEESATSSREMPAAGSPPHRSGW